MLPNPHRRLNSKTRKKLFNEHVRINGKRCAWSDRGPCSKGGLIVDDIQNDGIYTFETTQLLCRAHNHQKNPRGLGKFNPRRTTPIEDIAALQVTSYATAKNLACMHPYFRYVKKRVMEENGITYDEAVFAGAMKVDAAPDTTAKYLKMMLSSEGPLMLDKERKLLVFKTAATIVHQAQAEPLDTDRLAEEAAGASQTGPSGASNAGRN